LVPNEVVAGAKVERNSNRVTQQVLDEVGRLDPGFTPAFPPHMPKNWVRPQSRGRNANFGF
jgi:hypothetical protein